ncbi:Small nuclear RNA activating complex (SNAPc), subunit SNAP43 [Heracleum sosnowskyi]|uniref:Small nuclear RNA activating complex (SNAPc), subunit SNAP43 n=1 Tax=Heracleum sosnowskyi TaxID=360622 RepID=A0AAD8LX30_9APIA|nr:Small nuclear RNA activating complex (SNAPc), subunit SNAP43 [Heracleum sosnowskyi]
MKKVWTCRKFSFIYEARPTTNIGCFMQSLYSHCIGYVVANASLSTRLGGLYCLYCLYETQPYKPSFRIYISLGELRRLRKLVVYSKKENVNVAPALVNRMLERNMFLFGAVNLKESSVTEKMKELRAKEDATIRIAQKKLFENSQIEHFIHMDLDIQDIEHLTENHRLIGDVVGDTSEEWSHVKELFYQNTRYGQRPVDGHCEDGESCNLGQQQDTIHSELDHSPNERDDDNYQLEEDGIDDDFAMELEQELAHNEGDSEDELVMELEQTLSDYGGDSED